MAYGGPNQYRRIMTRHRLLGGGSRRFIKREIDWTGVEAIASTSIMAKRGKKRTKARQRQLLRALMLLRSATKKKRGECHCACSCVSYTYIVAIHVDSLYDHELCK